MSIRHAALSVTLIVAWLAAGTSAATQLWSAVGAASGELFGRGVGLIGDITGDGIEDYAVGAVGYDDWRGRVTVFDGATRTALVTLNGEHTGARFGGRLVATDDFNCDGVKDFAVASVRWGATGEGRVYILSGTGPGATAPLSVLFSVAGTTAGEGLGDALSGRLDFNGDGCGDILVGSPWNSDGGTNAGKIQVFGGPDGRLLWSRTGTIAERSLGISLAHADVNGDTYEDVIAGTFYARGLGKAYIYSGHPATVGALLVERTGTGTRDRFGVAIGDAGDFNRDDIADYAVAAPGGGLFHVYAGAAVGAGALLATIAEPAEGFASLGDVNGDGFEDFAAGVPSHKVKNRRYGKVSVFGGGGLLSSVVGPATDSDFGSYFSGAGASLLSGAPGQGSTGAAFLFALP